MTYDAFETSQEQGRPVELYRFTIGADSFFYTSAEDPITVAPIVYEPIAIRRAAVQGGPETRDQNLAIEMPSDDTVAELFKASIPGVRVRIEIDRLQRLDTPTPEVVRIFDGFVVSTTYTNNIKLATLTCRPAMSVLSRQIPRFNYHAACNHVLYDSGCKVSDADPAFRASNRSVTAVNGSVLTVAGLSGTYADGWFTGGFVEVVGGNDYRLVLDHVGNDLTLLFPFYLAPNIVNAFAGCDHSIATCKSKFDNVINFGGFAFVPTKNPFQTGVL